MMFVCVFAAYLLRNGCTDLAKLFLFALSWSRGGFRPKKIRIWDPVFPEIQKNPDFRVLALVAMNLNDFVQKKIKSINFWILLNC